MSYPKRTSNNFLRVIDEMSRLLLNSPSPLENRKCSKILANEVFLEVLSEENHSHFFPKRAEDEENVRFENHDNHNARKKNSTTKLELMRHETTYQLKSTRETLGLCSRRRLEGKLQLVLKQMAQL